MPNLPQILAVPEKAARYGSSRLGSRKERVCMTCTTVTLPAELQGVSYVIRGEKSYELSNHLGNVLAVVSDRREAGSCTDSLVDFYYADGRSVSDYYPFGMAMDSRTQSAVGYRWGFNGQEKDDEVVGEGNSYTAEFWQYDSRLGRRWNVDPVVKSHESSYATFANNPIRFIDPNGADTSFASSADRNFVLDLIDINSENYSEEFASKFNDLVGSSKTYHFESFTYNERYGYTGKIEESSELGRINIFFTKGDDRNAKNECMGRSVFGVLFEETFHAWEYEKEALETGHPSVENEARAWQFASLAPGTRHTVSGTSFGKRWKDFTVMGRINSASTEQVMQWFAHGMPSFEIKYTNSDYGFCGINGPKMTGLYSFLPERSILSTVAGGTLIYLE